MIRYGIYRCTHALRAGCLWLACELVAAAGWLGDVQDRLEAEL